MDPERTGRAAVVTGGSRGIGKAIARELAMEGCDVGLVGRDASVAEATARELAAQSGRRVIALPADTGDDMQVATMAERARDELGPAGINVTVVHPGMTRTERTPHTLATMAQSRGVSVEDAEATLTAGISIGRLVTAEEVAAGVAFLDRPFGGVSSRRGPRS
jgi:NAD(P)-dependent dehydrogenase (short-subunit alcohol dehydrogenase family)